MSTKSASPRSKPSAPKAGSRPRVIPRLSSPLTFKKATRRSPAARPRRDYGETGAVREARGEEGKGGGARGVLEVGPAPGSGGGGHAQLVRAAVRSRHVRHLRHVRRRGGTQRAPDGQGGGRADGQRGDLARAKADDREGGPARREVTRAPGCAES